MEESAPSSKSWWKYLIWGVVAVAAFGLSLAAGYRFGGPGTVVETPAKTAGQAPTQGLPGPITLEVVSELEAVRVQGGVDTAALAHWWQVLGVNAQALTFKELGGFPTYTPQSVQIVIKDISSLSLAERKALFSPVTGGQSGEVIAGSDTVYDPRQPAKLEYHIYHHPKLYSPEYPEITEENINRALFETLYVAVVGSTALTPDDYTAKRETAFPSGGGWQGIVKLEAAGSNGSGQSTRWHDARIWVAVRVQALKQWRLVPQAYAQSCGGTFYCGVLSPNCKCSGNSDDCSVHGSTCQGFGAGTCTCTPTCPSDPNTLGSCTSWGGQCRPPSGSCSNCVSEDFYTCGYSTAPTAPPGSSPAPTNPPAGVCVKPNVTITKTCNGTNATVTVDWGSTPETASWQVQVDDTSSFSSPDKNATRIPPDSDYSYISTVPNTTHYARVRISGGGCSPMPGPWSNVVSAGPINCGSTNTRPNADIVSGPAHNDDIKEGTNYTWGVQSSDAQANMTSAGAYIRRVGTPTWTNLHYYGGGATGTHNYTTNAWSCDTAGAAYELAVNAKEGSPPALECTGSSANAYNATTPAQTRCASGDDYRRFNCIAVDPPDPPGPGQCTATLSPNPMSLSVGGTGSLTLSVTGAGSINSTTWSKTGAAISMSGSGTTSRTITGVSSGNGTVNVNVTMFSGVTCSASSSVIVSPGPPGHWARPSKSPI